ncbi:hypothetical protein IWX49DRAFT_600239 [Phyllosticta citricarpa]|uniref:Uncharacterized protein n=1 Tax=Phyllosticta citricarpa TaxID=55181 RepID=A0ABR1M922_9PEZI
MPEEKSMEERFLEEKFTEEGLPAESFEDTVKNLIAEVVLTERILDAGHEFDAQYLQRGNTNLATGLDDPASSASGALPPSDNEPGLGLQGSNDKVENVDQDDDEDETASPGQKLKRGEAGKKTWTWADITSNLYAKTAGGEVGWASFSQALRTAVEAGLAASTTSNDKMRQVAMASVEDRQRGRCCMTANINDVGWGNSPDSRATDSACKRCRELPGGRPCLTVRRAGGFFLMPLKEGQTDINVVSHWMNQHMRPKLSDELGEDIRRAIETSRSRPPRPVCLIPSFEDKMKSFADLAAAAASHDDCVSRSKYNELERALEAAQREIEALKAQLEGRSQEKDH